MADQFEYQELLEKYIRQELTEEERTEVEELLLFNEEAREELKRLEEAFALGRQIDIKEPQHQSQDGTAASDNGTEPAFSPVFYRFAAAFILLLASGIAVIFLWSGEQNDVVGDVEQDWRQQYAEAYEQNPYLEEVIGDVLRGDRPQVHLSNPSTDHRISATAEEAEYQITFEGEVSGVSDASRLEIRIYSNETEDYIEENPMETSSLELDNAAFTTTLSLTVTPGLYYYAIEETDSAEVMVAGRIIVE